jgi:hypothetical protein
MTTKEGVHVAEALLRPTRLYRAVDVLTRPTPVPASAGIYAWYFNEVPPGIDPSGCHRHDDLVLLYAGISPKAPPTNGRKPSRSTLRQRLRTHYAGNAEGSTLRLTLGCLLASQLRFRLRRVGSGHRYTFTNPGEQLLDQWMADHAFVTWVEIDGLWEAEAKLLSSGLRLPLNLAGAAHRVSLRAMSRLGLPAEMPICWTSSRTTEDLIAQASSAKAAIGFREPLLPQS